MSEFEWKLYTGNEYVPMLTLRIELVVISSIEKDIFRFEPHFNEKWARVVNPRTSGCILAK